MRAFQRGPSLYQYFSTFTWFGRVLVLGGGRGVWVVRAYSIGTGPRSTSSGLDS